MSQPARPENGDWLSAAGSLVELPHGQVSDEPFARRVTEHLLGARSAEVREIIVARPSAVRVGLWEKLLRAAGETESRELFISRPQDAVCHLGEKVPERQRWSTLVEIYEACYRVALQGSEVRAQADSRETSFSEDTPGTSRLSVACLARTRWVLLSRAFAAKNRPRHDDVIRVNDGPRRLIVLAEQARDDWLAVLASIEDYPQLAGWIGDIEREVAGLISVSIAEPAASSGSGEDKADPVSREVAQFAATRLLLPRFAWGTATKIYLRTSTLASRLFSAAACAAILAVFVQLALGFIYGWKWGYSAAAATAVGVYLLVVCAMAADARAAWPWLLRQPASAAVGLLALAAFGPGWWFTAGSAGSTGRTVLVIAGLAGAALAYLYIEAIGHGVRGGRLAWRPPLIGVLGFIHGLLVSLIGLRFLMPVFAAGPTSGPQLACWYSGSCHGLALPVPALLGLAAAWSLAAGVFLQIIWDDQPVTAPLAHVSWRRGG